MGVLKETQCPMCQEVTKDYARKMSSGMVRWLGVLVRMSGPEFNWVKSSEVNAQMPGPKVGSDATALLPHWGLIETCPCCEKRGSWRPTKLGRDFILGREVVKRYVVTRDKLCIGFREPEVLADEITDGFDLDELLAKE